MTERVKMGTPMQLKCVTKDSKHFNEIHTVPDWKKHLPYGLNWTWNGGILGQNHVAKIQDDNGNVVVYLEEVKV